MFANLDPEARLAKRGASLGWLLGGVAALGSAAATVGAGLWLAGRWSADAPAAIGRELASAPGPAAPALPAASAAPAPARRIPEHGRLAVELDALREGEVLALALDMPDAARGNGERAVKVIDPGGRVLETTAAAAEGSGTGLRIEVDPGWLRPGRYLIEVASAEPHPLALRRYVLEVR